MVQQQYVSVGGHKTRYLECGGSGDFLVFLHGLGASADRWEFVAPLFGKHFRVIIPDLIGFGYSDKPAVDYTMEFFSDFLGSFLDELGIRKAHIVGSSLGGQISVEFTADNNTRVKKLVLVSPSGTMRTATPALDSYTMAALYPNVKSARRAFAAMDAFPKRIPNHIIEDFVSRMKLPNAKMAYMSTLLGLNNSADVRSRLDRIRVPTMLIWGDMDPVIPQNYSREFVSAIENCVYRRMPKSGHTPYVDNPDGFYRHVKGFLIT